MSIDAAKKAMPANAAGIAPVNPFGACASGHAVWPGDQIVSATQATATLAEDLQTKYAFVIGLLRAQQARDQILAHRERLRRPTKTKPGIWRDTPLTDALWRGAFELKEEAERCATHVQKYGQLLHAFEGTTVLQGGAA